MNSTLFWNRNYETLTLDWIFGISSLILHGYAISLFSAIIDYQYEKPDSERSSFDVLIKDHLRTWLYLLYFWMVVLFISLFTPPYITGLHNLFYWISYFGGFLGNFNNVSFFVTLYAKYVFVFHPDNVKNIQDSVLRRKCMGWKIILTIFAVLLNIAVPVSDPLTFKLLTKGHMYNR